MPLVSPLTSSLNASMDLTLHVVETAPYDALNIVNTERPYWIVSFVSEGKLRTETSGVRSDVNAGDVMVHPPYTPFSEISTGPGTHFWIGFDLKIPPNVDLFQVHAIAPVVKIADPVAYSTTFQRLQDICAEPINPLRDARAFGLSIELINQVIDSWRAAGCPERPQEMRTSRDRFYEIIQYMEAHLAERVQREDLAKLAFLHPGYFDRIFRGAYGISPMQMLRDIRLQHARRMLDEGEYSMDAIAEACGLADATYLSKVFRRRYGVSPGAYREGSKKARQSYILH